MINPVPIQELPATMVGWFVSRKELAVLAYVSLSALYSTCVLLFRKSKWDHGEALILDVLMFVISWSLLFVMARDRCIESYEEECVDQGYTRVEDKV